MGGLGRPKVRRHEARGPARRFYASQLRRVAETLTQRIRHRRVSGETSRLTLASTQDRPPPQINASELHTEISTPKKNADGNHRERDGEDHERCS
jgi:hypothetical protein